MNAKTYQLDNLQVVFDIHASIIIVAVMMVGNVDSAYQVGTIGYTGDAMRAIEATIRDYSHEWANQFWASRADWLHDANQSVSWVTGNESCVK